MRHRELRSSRSAEEKYLKPYHSQMPVLSPSWGPGAGRTPMDSDSKDQQRHEALSPNCSMTAPVVKRGRVASKQLSGSGPTRCKLDNEGNLGIMDCQTILRIAIPSPRIQEPRSVFFQVLTFLHCGVCRRAARQLQLVDRSLFHV